MLLYEVYTHFHLKNLDRRRGLTFTLRRRLDSALEECVTGALRSNLDGNFRLFCCGLSPLFQLYHVAIL